MHADVMQGYRAIGEIVSAAGGLAAVGTMGQVDGCAGRARACRRDHFFGNVGAVTTRQETRHATDHPAFTAADVETDGTGRIDQYRLPEVAEAMQQMCLVGEVFMERIISHDLFDRMGPVVVKRFLHLRILRQVCIHHADFHSLTGHRGRPICNDLVKYLKPPTMQMTEAAPLDWLQAGGTESQALDRSQIANLTPTS